jgi:hypothetical protein
MNEPVISNLVRIQPDPEYWYTVEDYYLDLGCDGLTISYWGSETEKGTQYKKEKRYDHVCIEKESALAIADAIYKLFKKNKDTP